MDDNFNSPSLAGIILAAGESRRMGLPKLFLRVHDRSLLENAVWFLAELMPTYLVTGAYPVETRKHLEQTQMALQKENLATVTLAHNPNWRKGMSSSIATGVKASLPLNPDGFFIIVADQPGINIELIPEYLEPFEQNPTQIIATWYPEGPGVPAIFPARFKEHLLANDGQAGAKRIIRNFSEDVIVVREDLPPFSDIDTPEDYEKFTGRKPE